MLTISKQQLCSAQSTVAAGSRKRSPVQWQQTILFESTGTHVTLATGSMSGFVWSTFECEGPAFRVAVDAGDLSALCSATRASEFRVSQKGNKLVFDGDTGRLALSCFPTLPEASEGWPALPQSDGEPHYTIKAGDLAYAIKAPAPAIDESSDKYSLGSVYIVGSADGVKSYATNGKVAVRVEAENVWLGNEPLDTLIPSAGVAILSAMLRGVATDQTVSVSRSGNSVIFDAGTATAHVTEESGRFPAIEKLLNEKSRLNPLATFSVEVSEIRSALRECIIGYDAAAEFGSTVLLACNGTSVRLLSNAHSDNDMNVSVESEASGEGGAILVDHAFVAKMCGSAGTDRVAMRLLEVGDAAALLITSDAGFTALAMGCTLGDANEKRVAGAWAGQQAMLV